MPEILKVGDIVAKRGELAKGWLKGPELNNGMATQIPVLVMNGVEDGKTLVLSSTEHGIEIEGTGIVISLMTKHLDPKKLKGAVIGVPVCNVTGYMANRYRSWVDHLCLRTVRADKTDGGFTETLANIIWTNITSKADVRVNMHCNTNHFAVPYHSVDLSLN